MAMVLSFFGLDDDKGNDSVLLYNSVRSNEQHLVKTTLDRGADVDFVSMQEPVPLRTPLRAACSQANVKLVRALLDRGAKVFANYGRDKWSALHSAAHGGHDHILRLLLTESDCLHENIVHEGMSLLHLLLECLSTRLLNGGADLMLWALRHMPTLEVNPKSQRLGYAQWTPLHLACARGCVKGAQCLLRAGAEVHARTADFNVRSALVNQLASTGSSQGAKVATAEADVELSVQWLDKGLLPIHLAAFGGHLRCVQLMLRHGQSINATTTRHRWTPLMFAVWSGNAALVREILRLGGRTVVNYTDRRGDGSEWTPLALAVARGSPDMVEALVEYGADPLVRLSWADFPGKAFLRHCAPLLLDAPENRWSGPDERVSLIHVAVVRGCVDMLRAVLPLVRTTHYSPVRSARLRPSLATVIPWQDAAVADQRSARGSARGVPGDERFGCSASVASQALDSSRSVQDQARARLQGAPVSEGQDCDPVTFCTTEGWSPAVLAALLHTIDPVRHVCGIELLEAFPDRTAANNTRADIFLELLSTGRALLEDRPDASPPVMPQRFHDVAETLVSRAVDEFVRLCKVGSAEHVALRILHTTLCVACRFNRQKVVRHLLETGLCDPRCRFLRPIECRPLHIATACGFGYLAQLLLEFKADPLECDENREFPVFKLTRFYNRQVSDLQERVHQLEAELREFREAAKLSTPRPEGTLGSEAFARFSPRSSGWPRFTCSPGATAAAQSPSRYDSVLHDSRM